MTKFLNISTDTTLGGSSAADDVVSSQKAIKGYVDNSGYLKNIATGSNSLTILGNPASYNYTVNIGYGSSVSNIYAVAIGYNSSANGAQEGAVAIGYDAKSTGAKTTAIGSGATAQSNGSIAIGRNSTVSDDSSYNYSIAIGCGVRVAAYGSIQLGGYGSDVINNEAGSFYVGLLSSGTTTNNYKLLGSDGKIPDARLNNPIPSQVGNSGKFLTTNGSSVSWGTVDTLPTQTGQSGKFLTTNGTSASWDSISIPSVEAYTAAEVDTLWNSITPNS